METKRVLLIAGGALAANPFSNRVRSTSRTASDGISAERAGHLR